MTRDNDGDPGVTLETLDPVVMQQDTRVSVSGVFPVEVSSDSPLTVSWWFGEDGRSGSPRVRAPRSLVSTYSVRTDTGKE